MFKTILVPLDGSEHSQTALENAIRIGQKYSAHLHLLHVIDVRALEGPLLHDISASLGAAPLVNYQAQIRSILEERARLIISNAEDRIRATSLTFVSKVTVGIINKEIVEAAAETDLVAMGRHGEHANWASILLGSTLEAVIRKANRPILVTSTPETAITKLLMAYNDDEHSVQALHVAANMASELDLPITVITCGESEWATATLNKAKNYLDPYQLDAVYIKRSGSPEKEIIEAASAENCDLVVMGAYGENRIHELILGSTTDAVIHNIQSPILLVR